MCEKCRTKAEDRLAAWASRSLKIRGLNATTLRKVAKVAKRVMEFVKDPAQALSATLKDLTGAGVDKLAKVIGWDSWPEWKAGGKALWGVAREVPGLRDYVRLAETEADNLFDSMAYVVLGQDEPAPGNVDPKHPPTSGFLVRWDPDPRWDPADPTDGKPKGFADLPVGTDVTYHLRGLVEEFAPITYTYADDSPAITFQELTAHGDWRGDFDFDDDYARHPGRQVAAGPYLTARKASDTQVEIEASYLRAMSWLVHPDPKHELEFEHEGDGESAFIWLDLAEDAAESKKQGRKLYRASLRMVQGTGHNLPRKDYGLKYLHVRGNHVGIMVERGGHATGATSERRRALGPLLGVFPGPDDSGVAATPAYQIAKKKEIETYLTPYQGRRWGVDSLASSVFKPYPVWNATGLSRNEADLKGELGDGPGRLVVRGSAA